MEEGGKGARVRVYYFIIYIKGYWGHVTPTDGVPRSGTGSQSFLSYSKQRLEFSALEYVGERVHLTSSDKLDFDWRTKQSAGEREGGGWWMACLTTLPLSILAFKGRRARLSS